MKILWVIVGCVCLAVGFVGLLLPVVPQVPFFIAAAVCFSKSSKKLEAWLKSRRFYKRHLRKRHADDRDEREVSGKEH